MNSFPQSVPHQGGRTEKSRPRAGGAAAGDRRGSSQNLRYDLKTGITTVFPQRLRTGSIVLNSRLFGEIIRRLPDDEVTVSTAENLMTHISCLMSEFEILGMTPVDYPELPTVDTRHTIRVEAAKLRSMISQTNFAVSFDESRPIHTGSLFEVENGMLTVVAVDGFRLALRREQISDASDKCSFVVPGAALSEVEKIIGDGDDEVTVSQGDKHIVFISGGTVLISRRLEGEFLNYKNSIPRDGKYIIEADRRSLVESVERVSLIINEKLKSPIRCTFEDGVLKMLTYTAIGKASDECSVKGNGDGLEIGFNNRYLSEALKAAPADSVKLMLTSSVSPCVIVACRRFGQLPLYDPAREAQNHES